ncbi:TolC family protein [Halonatronum saccharophilum]|uniref:TolC family protein n=1 Tax=Halonatronum saccharophilum TaxID=150060 RepID=UPI000486CDAB|nr:TolC family protein [Halonatronum saccharophilum]
MKVKLNFKMLVISSVLILVSRVAVVGAEQSIEVREAIELMLEDSIDVHIARLELENAMIDYEKSQGNNLLRQSDSFDWEARLNFIEAEDNYYRKEVGLIKEILSQYSDLNLAQLDLQVRKMQFEIEEFRLARDEQEADRGYKNQLELLSRRNSYNNVLFNLDRAKRDLRERERIFKTSLNLDESKIKLDLLSVGETFEISKDEFLEEALNNNLLLQLRGDRLRLSEIEFEDAKLRDMPRLDLKIRENSLEIARMQREVFERDLRASLEGEYYNFIERVKELEMSASNLKELRDRESLVFREEEKGLRSTEDLLLAQIEVLQAKQSYQRAVLNYYISKLEIKEEMGWKVEVLIDEF